MYLSFLSIRSPHRALGLKPKRTLRLVLWTDEEAGGVGSKQYYQAHKAEAANYSILLESDEGVFTPYGMEFTGSDAAMKVSFRVEIKRPDTYSSSNMEYHCFKKFFHL